MKEVRKDLKNADNEERVQKREKKMPIRLVKQVQISIRRK